MFRYKMCILIALFLNITLVPCYPTIANFWNVGFGGCGVLRHWNTNQYMKFSDIGIYIGFNITERLRITFDYENNYILPFRTKDNVREYQIYYNDFLLSGVFTIYKKASIQTGLGLSFSRSYLKFLEDDYLCHTPFDSILFHKGEIVDMYDFPRITAKIAFLLTLPVFDDHFSLYCKAKGKTGPLGAAEGSYIPSSPHIPFHFSSGLSFSL